MAIAEGYADRQIAGEVEDLAPFIQKLHGDMVKMLFKDKPMFDKIKKKLEKIAKS